MTLPTARKVTSKLKAALPSRLSLIFQVLRGRQGILLACVLLAGALFGLTNESFLTPTNLSNIGVQSSMILIIAFGMTVVIVSGGIDLSVGSTAAVSGVLAVWLIENPGFPTPLAMLLVGVGFGCIMGFAHGLVTSWFGVPALIATLATLLALRGVAFLISDGLSIQSEDPLLLWLANNSIGPIPIPILLAVVTLVIVHMILTHTALGRSFYAIGGNQQAARLAGINARRVSIAAYTICAVLAAVAGLIAASRTGSGSPNIGNGWELQAVAIVILGGANLFGGSGRVTGTLLAGILLGMINNWMSLEGLGATLQGLIFGTLLIFVVAVNQGRR